MRSSARRGIDAAATYHGAGMGQHLDEVPTITCPVSFHFGAEDPIAPMDEVRALEQAFASHANADIGVHLGVGHNFAMPYKQGSHATAAAESRARVLRCFPSLTLTVRDQTT
ncbi:MAG: dienelactone hydrolase family protein [Candidatus Binatia bacterium]